MDYDNFKNLVQNLVDSLAWYDRAYTNTTERQREMAWEAVNQSRKLVEEALEKSN